MVFARWIIIIKLFRREKISRRLKTETEGVDIREEIKDSIIRIIYVQIKSLKGHAGKLKENFNCELKEAND